MRKIARERLLSELPDGQAGQVLWLVDELITVICEQMEKYRVNQDLGVGIVSIVMAKIAGYTAAMAGTDEPGLNEAIDQLSNNIKINTVGYYKLKKEEMQDEKE